MSTTQYNTVNSGDSTFVTVFRAGLDPFVASDQHPNWPAIQQAVEDGYPTAAVVRLTDEELVALFDTEAAIRRNLAPLSGRVSVAFGKVYFDGEEADGSITRQIMRFLEAGVPDWQPLCAFMEAIAANPQEHSREQLYDWLRKRDFTILPSGEVVAYKGVGVDAENLLHSLNCGTAYVDGVRHEGHIPNPVGSVVTMPRDGVEHNPSVGCSVGLHVGTYEYARSYAQGAMLQVAVNPADVVSVPVDGAGEKVRVCRYRILDVIDEAPADEPEPVTEEPTPGRIARWTERITRMVGR